MTRLVLVRHGETDWHADNRYAGRSDVDLSRRGMQQASLLAGWAETAGLSAVWSSNLTRARRTAEVCAERSGCALHVDARLRELDFGRAEGLTAQEMEQCFPDLMHAFRADPVTHHLPDGEDPVQAAQRFTECVDDIATRHPDGRVLVVAHATALRLALCLLIGVPLREYRQLFPVVHNCALSEVDLQDGQVALMQFNAPLQSKAV